MSLPKVVTGHWGVREVTERKDGRQGEQADMTKWLWKAWVQQLEDGQYPSPVFFFCLLCVLLVNMRGGSYMEILSSDESSPSQAL